jgi:hypothetical protein
VGPAARGLAANGRQQNLGAFDVVANPLRDYFVRVMMVAFN